MAKERIRRRKRGRGMEQSDPKEPGEENQNTNPDAHTDTSLPGTSEERRDLHHFA